MTKTGSKIWTSVQLRESFINFFKSKDHPIIPSSSVIPKNDPTLLFTNSGMVQFKSRFLNEKSEFSDLKRACSIQHCIRAGGKHNDLEDVGHDTYHHTFFEMMGNWSFGDYGKETAIQYVWEYLTDVLDLEKERLYATYFSPNSEYLNVPEDIESKNIWIKYLPEERVLPFAKENFWEMGNIGPCGPCTEIHYDMSGQNLRAKKVNKDDPSLIEVWNLVFMQYYRNKDDSLQDLETLSVDTGMGFERLLGILNRVSNYETDLFLPLFNLTKLNYIPDNLFSESCDIKTFEPSQDTQLKENGTESEKVELLQNLSGPVENIYLDEELVEEKKSQNENPVEKKKSPKEEPVDKKKSSNEEPAGSVEKKKNSNEESAGSIEKTDLNQDTSESNENMSVIKDISESVEKLKLKEDIKKTAYKDKGNFRNNNFKSLDSKASNKKEKSTQHRKSARKENSTKFAQRVELSKKHVFPDNVVLRIIADHARTISVCLSNDLSFAPDGPGYVLRRITRRMIRIAEEKNVQNLKQIVEGAAKILNLEIKEEILDLFDKEYTQFKKTLGKGVKYFNSLTRVTPEEIFRLKDTYGFPIDLTEQLCKENNIKFDKKKIDKLIEEAIDKSKQRKRS